MFKGNNRSVRITPKNGQQVLVRARVSLYEPRGDFQLILEQMDDAGAGLLQQQYEALKNQLANEGLFDPFKKKPIPSTINKVGIVTSPTGAAVKDILTVLKRRNPTIEAIIYPALVQGDLASSQIARAVNIANERNECDVLIVGRGGGSLEDLWCFNEEVVVRALYQSKLPIISAVGHEIDTTLADFVADLRAPTPSAAAELVSANTDEIKSTIQVLEKRLCNAVLRNYANDKKQLQTINFRLSRVHPAQQLQMQQQKADELNSRLIQAIKRKSSQSSILPQQLHQRLMQSLTVKEIEQHQVNVSSLNERLLTSIKRNTKHKQQLFAQTLEQLNIVSPLATIARGYSVTRDEKSNIIRSTEQVKVGDKIQVQLTDGNINAQIIN